MKKMKFGLTILVAGLAFSACKPKMDKDITLPAPSAASFEIAAFNDLEDPANKNSYIFTNTTEGGFITSWDFGGVAKSTQAVDTVFFAYKGDYQIKMLSSSKGGTSTLIKTLTVEENSPYAADFAMVDGSDAFHFTFNNTTPNPVSVSWKLPDGRETTGSDASIYLPWAGTYDITQTVVTSKGPSTITKQITIENDDPNNPDLNDPIFTLLTGGKDDTDGKTWVLDLTPKISGVGPYKANAIDLSYWNYPDGFGEAFLNGAAANEYTFIMRKYQYVPLNQKVTVHYNWAVSDFGKPYVQYNDLALVDPNHKAEPFILKNEGVGMTGYTLKFGGKTYMGYMDGRRNYEIAKITTDSMWVRHKYSDIVADDPANDQNQRVFVFTAK